MIPELRTTPRLAIVLSLAAVASVAVAVLAGSRLEEGLGSGAAATAVLVVWCTTGWSASIAALVDAYVKPEGELLGLAVTIAATVFAVIGLAVVSGVVAGFADFSAGSETSGERDGRSD